MDGWMNYEDLSGVLSLQANLHCTLDDRVTKGDRESEREKRTTRN
jgi:hypothetical protein